ncbi:MAG TPA: 4,5-DOPA dioxygenase extradiol [Acidimicrobiales bacterium]|nr:4,5-DOPA dioxygenase extradiol [Acidimicrobiales bacterium]
MTETAAGTAPTPAPSGRMPVAFIGHGNPMYAIEPNRYADVWGELGRQLPRPSAVLAISAHWYVAGTAVTEMAHPRTIHDFGGFPKELFEVVYPAPGSLALAQRVRRLIDESHLIASPVVADTEWGLDHGTWSVARHLYPKADVPIVQLSIDGREGPEFHLRLGSVLAPLRDEGVLIFGSGNVVHNLQMARLAGEAPPLDWAVRFEAEVRRRIDSGRGASLADLPALGPDASLSVPTPDHYLPLLYVLGAASPDDGARFPVEGIDAGSLSMLSVVLG